MNLFRTQRKTPGQEHGDWRLPLEKPAETEHLPPREPTVWRKMRLRARYLQAMPVGADSTYASEETEGTSSLAPIAGWSRFVRLMLAWLILLPLSILLTYALLLHLYRAGDTVGQREFWLSVPVWYSLLGAGAFISLIVARIATPILVYIYVLGHELTHAIAAIICLGRVQTLRIGLDGGYVETDTDNLFIASRRILCRCGWAAGWWRSGVRTWRVRFRNGRRGSTPDSVSGGVFTCTGRRG